MDIDLIQINDYRNLCEKADTFALIKDADLAMKGMLLLNGTGGKHVYVGEPPKWHENQYGVGGYTWTLSRLEHIATLCKVFCITNNKAYLTKAESDLENWLDTVLPPPVPFDFNSANVYHGIHNWRMLELGYRMSHTFPVILPIIRQFGKEELVFKLYHSIKEHAQRISAGSHLLWPNADHNHYVEEITGLLAAASILGNHSESASWAKQAVEGLEIACKAQITESGAQIEGVPLYHNAVIENLCLAILYAEKMNLTFSQSFMQSVYKGLDASLHMMNPSGTIAAIGDSDPDTSSIRNAVLSFLLFGEERWIETVRRMVTGEKLIAEAVSRGWGYPRINKFLEYLDSQPIGDREIPLPCLQYQPEIGHVYIRTGWGADATYLAFTCKSPVYHSAHSHMEQLGFEFHAMGKTLLRDSGRFTYRDDNSRHAYKSSEAHNVPTINGRDAFEYISTFVYGIQKEGCISSVIQTTHIQGATGYHDNYAPVRIMRSIALIDGLFLLIADRFINGIGACAKVFFQIDSTAVRTVDGRVYSDDEEANISIASTIKTAEIAPTHISDKFYHERPATRVIFSQNLSQNDETFFTIAVPFKNFSVPEFTDFQIAEDRVNFCLNGKAYSELLTIV